MTKPADHSDYFEHGNCSSCDVWIAYAIAAAVFGLLLFL
jgi:hypothetical protein